MTGKQIKDVIASIPDDAEVDIEICEKGQATFCPSGIIKGMTVQQITQFSKSVIFRDKRIAIVIFDVEADKTMEAGDDHAKSEIER